MKTYLCALCAAAFLLPGVVAADGNTQESTPIELSAAQMDQITAGSLQLPNGKLVFDGFDNPAPNAPAGYIAASLGACDGIADPFCHPALNRRSDVAFVTAEKGPQVTPLGNDGPWTATVASPVISCPDCP
jgi:hypothetical protein